jgi:hypothetical protein
MRAPPALQNTLSAMFVNNDGQDPAVLVFSEAPVI